MTSLNIDFDFTHAYGDLRDTEKRHVPYAISLTLNRTMRDARANVRKKAYTRAFHVRNQALINAITAVPKWSTKNRPTVAMMNARDKRTGRLAGAGFIERQVKGREKTPKGGSIAIPVLGVGLRRLKTGSVPAAKKPRVMGGKLVKIERKDGSGTSLYQRKGKKLVRRYNLVQHASPNRRGRFTYFQTAEQTATHVAQRHWQEAITKALATAR